MSHARATAHSRFTVAGEISMTSAGFLDAHTAEVAELDDARLIRIERGELLDRIVQCENVDGIIGRSLGRRHPHLRA